MFSDVIPNNWSHAWACEWTAEELSKCLDKWSIKNNREIEDLEIEDLLRHTISILLLFVRYNFTGPFDQLAEIQKGIDISNVMKEIGDPFDKLKVNGEEVNVNTNLGKLLIFVRDNLFHLLCKHKNFVVCSCLCGSIFVLCIES